MSETVDNISKSEWLAAILREGITANIRWHHKMHRENTLNWLKI
jgi:hypothetical protein